MTALVTENLPLLAAAPNGINQLRSLILDLAIRGKLVPQSLADEPAEVLLERIRATRQAAATSRKPKTEPSQSADVSYDGPFELPAGWLWTTLATVSLVNPRNAAPDDVSVSFVPMASIGAKFDSGHTQEVRRWGEVKQGFTHFAEGDIGVAKITPCFENSKACVFTGLTNGIGAGTTELHVVRPFAGTLAPRYVLAYLKSPWFLLTGESRMTGTAGQKRLPKDFVESHPFPLPPLEEQHRIVAKVDELMALCDRLEAEQADAEAAHAQLVAALLTSLTQARDAADFRASWQQLAEHFHTLFTTEASVDALKQAVLELGVTGRLTSFGGAAQWRHIKLGSVAKLINGDRGTNYPNRSEYVPEGIPFINTGHINPDGSLDLGAMHYLTRQKFESLRSGKIEPDDLVYCLRGATLGKTAFVRPFSEGAIASSLVILRFAKVVLPEFAYYFLVSPPGRRWIWKFDNGSAQPNLAASSVREYEMPLPSLEEQQKVVRRIAELLALCDQLKLNLAQASRQHEHLASVLVEQAVS